MILRSHPPIGYRAAAVGIDALGAAGDKPGAERGEEGADPADEDQKGIEQANQHAAEQSAAHRGLPRQMPGFQGDEGEGGAEIERDAHRQINRPGADDQGHRHRHNQQDRAALQQVGPVIHG